MEPGVCEGSRSHLAYSAGTHKNRESVIGAGMFPVLVQSLNRDGETAAEAAWALCNMANGDQKCKDAVLQAGTVTVRLVFCDSKRRLCVKIHGIHQCTACTQTRSLGFTSSQCLLRIHQLTTSAMRQCRTVCAHLLRICDMMV